MYERLIQYLVSEPGTVRPRTIRHWYDLEEIIYNTLVSTVTNAEEFKKVFNDYPVLEEYALNHVFKDWYRLK
jgi:hypothetical protein